MMIGREKAAATTVAKGRGAQPAFVEHLSGLPTGPNPDGFDGGHGAAARDVPTS